MKPRQASGPTTTTERVSMQRATIAAVMKLLTANRIVSVPLHPQKHRTAAEQAAIELLKLRANARKRRERAE